MGCAVIRKDGGVTVIACTRGRRAAPCQVSGCSYAHECLCDYELTGDRKGARCDMKLCVVHRTKSRGRDLCPIHAKMEREIEHPAESR